MKSFLQKILNKSYSLIEEQFFKKTSFFRKKNTLLILRIDSIGDYVLFRNYLNVIRKSEKYKNHKITLCGNNWWKELSEKLDHNDVDDFIWIDYTRAITDFRYRFELNKKIYFRGFETVVQPTYSRDWLGDQLVILSGAKVKIGNEGDEINLTPQLKEKNNSSYSILIPSAKACCFEFERNREFILQWLTIPVNIPKPFISSAQPTEMKIIFFPGAKDAFRRWSPENFYRLGSLLNENFPSYELLIGGSKQDANLANEIMALGNVPFTNCCGKYSLQSLIDFIASAEIIIANDSGPFHIATALGKKVIGLSNGNNYGRFTPYPSSMKTQSEVIYPLEVMQYPEVIRIKKFCREVKEIDINTITVEQVFLLTKEKLTN